MNNLSVKLREYIAQLACKGGLCVAFSGGVDSAVLLKVCSEVTDNVIAVTFNTALHPVGDVNDAKRIANAYGVKHEVLDIDEFADQAIMQNPIDRCYLCKSLLFRTLRDFAKEQGFSVILDGTNADDLKEYRPGLKAIAELSVISPLAELRISKQEVRELAKEFALDVANKPSSPCLATRLPYNTKITKEKLTMIDEGEKILRQMGFEVTRLRLHDDIVRIEIAKDKLLDAIKYSDQITEKLKALGFKYITLDLEAFRSGSMDIYTEV